MDIKCEVQQVVSQTTSAGVAREAAATGCYWQLLWQNDGARSQQGTGAGEKGRMENGDKGHLDEILTSYRGAETQQLSFLNCPETG